MAASRDRILTYRSASHRHPHPEERAIASLEGRTASLQAIPVRFTKLVPASGTPCRKRV